jgi:hypothetical protein
MTSRSAGQEGLLENDAAEPLAGHPFRAATPREPIVVLPRDLPFAGVAAEARRLGLDRDADAVVQSPVAPAFASWTGRDGDDREVDYHAQDGSRWLVVRGRDAEALAGALAAVLCGRVVLDPTKAWADVLSAPAGVRGATDGPLGANGATRWRVLRAAVAAFGEANRQFVEALVLSGLQDPDWRVRMAAVLAIGRLRLASLTDGVMAAAPPKAGEDGICQEDRRALLAFRRVAHDRALTLPPDAPASASADVAARRRDHQRRLHALLAGSLGAGWGREATLLAALLDGPEAVRGRVPGAWRGWLGDD